MVVALVVMVVFLVSSGVGSGGTDVQGDRRYPWWRGAWLMLRVERISPIVTLCAVSRQWGRGPEHSLRDSGGVAGIHGPRAVVATGGRSQSAARC